MFPKGSEWRPYLVSPATTHRSHEQTLLVPPTIGQLCQVSPPTPWSVLASPPLIRTAPQHPGWWRSPQASFRTGPLHPKNRHPCWPSLLSHPARGPSFALTRPLLGIIGAAAVSFLTLGGMCPLTYVAVSPLTLTTDCSHYQQQPSPARPR